MAKFYPATKDVVETVERMIKLYHPELEDADIGVLLRDEAPASDGKITFGQAKKVTPELRALMPYHFVIWFAEDQWYNLSQAQRDALADHELCHCKFDPNTGTAKMRDHDFAEFNCILERHGFWWPGAGATKQAVEEGYQKHSLFGRLGRVTAVEVGGQALQEALN